MSKVISDETARMEALRAAQDAEEAAAIAEAEPVAAGAENQKGQNFVEGSTSSKMVLNNIVFYGEASSELSLPGVQPGISKGTDPPS